MKSNNLLSVGRRFGTSYTARSNSQLGAWLSVVVALIVLPPTGSLRAADSQSMAGTTELPDVDPPMMSGTWIHRVPLDLPPAPKGLVPDLGLAANHMIPDGVLGSGWELQGFSRIERRSPTKGVPNFDNDESHRFFLDGMELIPVTRSGPDDCFPSEEDAPVDLFFKLRKDDRRLFAYNPCSDLWTVTGRGNRWWYGEFHPVGRNATEYQDESNACLTDLTEILDFQQSMTACMTGPGDFPIQDNSSCALADIDKDDDVDLQDYAYLQIAAQGSQGGVGENRGLGAASGQGGAGGTCGTEVRSTAWLISQRRDEHDNTISYEYDRCNLRRYLASVVGLGSTEPVLLEGQFAYQHLPERIKYARDDYVEIRFEYENRPDIRTSARSGRIRLLDRRLKAIQVVADAQRQETPDTRYEMTYLDEAESDCDGGPVPWGSADMSLLQEITRVGTDGKRKRVRCMEYNTRGDWGFSEFPDYELELDVELPSGADEFMPLSVNFDGDPFPELVLLSIKYGSTTHTAWRNTGEWASGPGSDRFNYDESFSDFLNGVISADLLASGQGEWAFVDIDGDSRTELLIAATPGYAGVNPGGDVYDGASISARKAGWINLLPDHLKYGQFVDINGDGLLDLVIRPNSDSKPERTRWIPNSGLPLPYLDYDDLEYGIRVLNNPLEDPDNPARQSLEEMWTACKEKDPDSFPEYAPFPTDVSYSMRGTRYTIRWQSLEEYLWAQTRMVDVNRDGIVDLVTAISTCWTVPGTEPLLGSDEVFSHIFFGDGNGNYYDTGLSAGTPFYGSVIISTGILGHYAPTTWLAMEADGSPYIEMTTASVSSLMYSNHGIPRGFDVPPGTSAGSSLPGGAAVVDAARGIFKVLGDFDANGFTDVVVFQQPKSIYPTGLVPFSGSVYLNHRATGRGRLERIHTPWGGEIELEYGPSTYSNLIDGDAITNTGLPYVVEVVKSVADGNGEKRFGFRGGRHDGAEREFLGFRDSLIQHQNGRTTHVRFETVYPYHGEVLSRAEHGANGFMEFFQVNQHIDPAATTSQATPPFITPLFRRCDFWLAHSEQQQDLVDCCFNWQQNVLWVDQGDWPQLDVDIPLGVSPYSPLAQPLLEGLEGLALPPWPERLSGDPPIIDPTGACGQWSDGSVMLVQDWKYDEFWMVEEHMNHRDVVTTGDDLKTNLEYDACDASNYGKQLLSTVLRDSAQQVLRTEIRSNFADFDQPQTVTEHGSMAITGTCANGGTSPKLWNYTFDSHGQLMTSIDPEAGLKRVLLRNDCGQIILEEDEVKRQRTTSYDAACRRTGGSFEGGTVTIVRDGFGRVVTKTVDAGTSSAPDGSGSVTELWFRNDDAGPNEPRAGVQYADGSIRLMHYDGWGRKIRTITCDGPSQPVTNLSQLVCTGPTVPSHHDIGYATDGTVRFATRGYNPADPTVAATWFFREEFGRVERRLSPAPIIVQDGGSPRFVETQKSYLPGKTTVIDPPRTPTDPTGVACSTFSDTLSSTLECDGAVLLNEFRDALGNTVRSLNADGVETTTKYDRFYRVCQQQVNTTVQTCDGLTVIPTVEFEYDAMDRLLVERDVEGNETRFAYDAAGRKKLEEFVEFIAGTVHTLNDWTYFDAATGSRRVKRTDINDNHWTSFLDGRGRAYKIERPDELTNHKTWNNRGQLASVTDVDGLTMRYEYNAAGKLAKAIGPDPSWEQVREHNRAGELVYEVDRDGVETLHLRTWSGKPGKILRGPWTLAEWRYYDDGLVKRAVEGGTTTTFDYNGLGQVTNTCIGAENQTCGIEVDSFWTNGGRLLSQLGTGQTGPQSLIVYAYDGLDRVTQIVHADMSIERIVYDALGRRCRHTDEDGVKSEWDHDAFGRVVKERLPGQGERTIIYYHGFPNGSMPFNKAQQRRTEPDGGLWITESDFMGRNFFTIRPDQSNELRTWNGNRLDSIDWRSPVDQLHTRKTFEYDANGRLIKEWGPFEGLVPNEDDDIFQAYEWRPSGRQDTVEGPNDKTTYEYEYGLLRTEKDGIDGATSASIDTLFEYDPDYPRLRAKTVGINLDPGQRRVHEYAYTRGMWLTTETITEDNRSLWHLYQDRNAYGTPLTRTSIHQGEQPVIYAHQSDIRGRLSSTMVTIDGQERFEITREFQKNGLIDLVTVNWPGLNVLPQQIDYIRPNAFLVTQVTNNNGTVYGDYSARDELARPTYIEMFGGGHQEYEYDKLGRVETHYIKKQGPGFRRRTYTYDGLGRNTQMDWEGYGSFGTRTFNYVYNAQGWLEEEHRWNGQIVEFDYDRAGNRVHKTTTDPDGIKTGEQAMTYAYGNRLDTYESVLAATGEVQVTWDDTKGCIIKDHLGTTIDRDPAGRPKRVEDRDGKWSMFTRNHLHQPVLTRYQDLTESYQVWESGRMWPIAGIDREGKPFLRVEHASMLLARVEDGLVHRVASDRQGSLVLVDDQFPQHTGAWGDIALTPDTTSEDYIYAGQQKLATDHLYSAQQRLYSKDLGIFMSKDPIGRAGGHHPMMYARNNPLSFTDSTGLYPQFAPIGISPLDLVPVRQARQPGSQSDDPPGDSDGKDFDKEIWEAIKKGPGKITRREFEWDDEDPPWDNDVDLPEKSDEKEELDPSPSFDAPTVALANEIEEEILHEPFELLSDIGEIMDYLGGNEEQILQKQSERMEREVKNAETRLAIFERLHPDPKPKPNRVSRRRKPDSTPSQADSGPTSVPKNTNNPSKSQILQDAQKFSDNLLVNQGPFTYAPLTLEEVLARVMGVPTPGEAAREIAAAETAKVRAEHPDWTENQQSVEIAAQTSLEMMRQGGPLVAWMVGYTPEYAKRDLDTLHRLGHDPDPKILKYYEDATGKEYVPATD